MNIRMISILLTPLAGIIFGACIAFDNHISLFKFASNIIAVILGIPLALLTLQLRVPLQRHLTMLSFLALCLMVISLLSFGSAGVHRWVSIGSMCINISMVFGPLILYAISASLGHNNFLPIILTSSVLVIHVLQPDAGQGTAFACAAIVIFLLNNGAPFLMRIISIIVIGVGIMLVWHQPDSLPAVDEVEYILHLAIRIGGFGAIGIVFTMVFLLAPMLYTLHYQRINSDNGILALAFIIYLIATFWVTELGNYPVPIIGAGASSVLGWYTMIGFVLPPQINDEFSWQK